MQKIKVSTYFDITPTGIVRSFRPAMLPIKRKDFTITNDIQWYHRRRQQANWETIFQIVMMRIQPETITDPILEEIQGKKVWSFVFKHDVEYAYKDASSDDPLYVIKQDASDVPMITGLEESEKLDKHLIDDTNIFFELIHD